MKQLNKYWKYIRPGFIKHGSIITMLLGFYCLWIIFFHTTHEITHNAFFGIIVVFAPSLVGIFWCIKYKKNHFMFKAGLFLIGYFILSIIFANIIDYFS